MLCSHCMIFVFNLPACLGSVLGANQLVKCSTCNSPSRPYFSFTLCSWLLWLLEAGKYCSIGRVIFRLPEFLCSFNGKKQNFLGGANISFPFHSHTATVVSAGPAECNCCGRVNKGTIQRGEPLPFRTALAAASLAGARYLTGTGFAA